MFLAFRRCLYDTALRGGASNQTRSQRPHPVRRSPYQDPSVTSHTHTPRSPRLLPQRESQHDVGAQRNHLPVAPGTGLRTPVLQRSRVEPVPRLAAHPVGLRRASGTARIPIRRMPLRRPTPRCPEPVRYRVGSGRAGTVHQDRRKPEVLCRRHVFTERSAYRPFGLPVAGSYQQDPVGVRFQQRRRGQSRTCRHSF